MKLKSSISILVPMCAALLLAGCGTNNSGTTIPDPDTHNPGEGGTDPNNPGGGETDPDNPGGGETDPDNPDGGDVEVPEHFFIQKPTTIVVKSSIGKQNRGNLEAMVNSFKSVEPNVTVKLEYPGGNATVAANTLTEFQTGNHGDLVYAYPDSVADFLDQGYAFNLNPYINNPDYGLGDDAADYIETYMKEGQGFARRGTYLLPFSKSTEALFYDAQKLLTRVIPGINGGKAIDLEYMNTLTWEKLFTEFCPAIEAFIKTPEGKGYLRTTDSTGKETKWGIIGCDSDANLFITLAEQYGYPYTSVNKDTGVGSFDFYKTDGSTDNMMLAKMTEFGQYAKKHYIMTTNSLGDKHPNDLLKTNNCLLSIGSTAGLSYQFDPENPKQMLMARLPQAEGRPTKLISQGPGFSLLGHKTSDGGWDEDRKLASWLFYKHITTVANNAIWSTNANYMPIRETVYKTPEYKEAIDMSELDANSFEALTARMFEYGQKPEIKDHLFTSPAFKGSRVARDTVEVLVGDIFKLEKVTTEAVKKLFEAALNDILLKS